MLAASFLSLLAASLAIALPTASIEPRSTAGVNASELEDGPCRDITFIWARASTENGTMGGSLGPLLCNELKTYYNEANVACQGVGGPYTADLYSNTLPLGTSQAAIGEATRLFELANNKCPKTTIVAGGYSQGTAVIAASTAELPPTIQDQTAAVVLFGYTRNAQNGQQIPDFAIDKTLIYCNEGDEVCFGTLNVTAAHYEYEQYIDSAALFLESIAGIELY